MDDTTATIFIVVLTIVTEKVLERFARDMNCIIHELQGLRTSARSGSVLTGNPNLSQIESASFASEDTTKTESVPDGEISAI